MTSYRIKENVSGEEVWNYLEGLIDDMGARVRTDDSRPMAIIFGFGSLRRSIVYWMQENLREPVEDEEKIEGQEELEAEQEARFPLTFREAIDAMMEGRAVESEALPDVEQRLSEAGFECRKLGKDKWYHSLDFSEDEVSGKWRAVE